MDAVPGDYILLVGPFDNDIYHFTLLAETQSNTGIPTQNSTVSLATTATSKPTTNQETPLSIIVPIIAIGRIGFFEIFRKK